MQDLQFCFVKYIFQNDKNLKAHDWILVPYFLMGLNESKKAKTILP